MNYMAPSEDLYEDVEQQMVERWTVKGIDRKAIEMSKSAARKRGMVLGKWVSLCLIDCAREAEGKNLIKGENDKILDEIRADVKRMKDAINSEDERISDIIDGINNIAMNQIKISNLLNGR